MILVILFTYLLSRIGLVGIRWIYPSQSFFILSFPPIMIIWLFTYLSNCTLPSVSRLSTSCNVDRYRIDIFMSLCPKKSCRLFGLPVRFNRETAPECLRRWRYTLLSIPALLATAFIICHALCLLIGKNLISSTIPFLPA